MGDTTGIDDQGPVPGVRLVAVGGGALRVVDRFRGTAWPEIGPVGFDTDARELDRYPEIRSVRLGKALVRGLGCGGDEEMGRLAAESDRPLIADALAGGELVVLVGCLGRGCASGALPVIAGLIGETGCPMIAVVSTPFEFEGRRPAKIAREALAAVRKSADCVIELPNDLLFQEAGDSDRADRIFDASDEWMSRAVTSLVGPLFRPGKMSVDLATFRAALKGPESRILFSTARVPLAGGAAAAAKAIFECPLRSPGIERARADRLLVSIGSAGALSAAAFAELATGVTKLFDSREDAVVGFWEDPALGEDLEVTVVARTDLSSQPEPLHRSRPVEVHASKLDGKRSRRSADRVQTEFDSLLEHNERGLFGRMAVDEYNEVDLDKPTFLRRGIKIPMPKGFR